MKALNFQRSVLLSLSACRFRFALRLRNGPPEDNSQRGCIQKSFHWISPQMPRKAFRLVRDVIRHVRRSGPGRTREILMKSARMALPTPDTSFPPAAFAALSFAVHPAPGAVTEAWVQRFSTMANSSNDKAVSVVRDAAGDIVAACYG